VNKERYLMVLNASAGSGKTYTLVKEFIKLLVDDERENKHFSQIIAMTFTNMASLEMKTRIVKALDELSYPERHGARSHGLAMSLSSETGISPEEVHSKCRTILKMLLHSYEDFSVMTIDKFNLKLIRSFSRDLNLPADFEVVLNENQLIEQVVDLLMSGMGSAEEKEFTQAAISYAKNNLEQEESWDFRKSLIQFGSTFSKESELPFLEKLIATDFNEDTRKEIKKEIHAIDEEFFGLTKKLNDLHESYGSLSNQYVQGSNTIKSIHDLTGANSIMEKRSHKNTLEACKKETPKGKFFPDELKDLLLKINQFQNEQSSVYATYAQFLKNFHNMVLLKFMASAIERMKQDEKVIRISEFNKLISELVQQENAPFIYERLGNRFHHFLLDEFQDTSHLQWLNIVPLVEESISNGHLNLIVGDPKQSIYRFKNGVAEQFVELPGIYNPKSDPEIARRSAFFRQAGFTRELKENWRSGSAIVSFNNELFKLLRSKLPPFAQAFYDSVDQTPKTSFEGYVNIESRKLESKEIIDLEKKVIGVIQSCISDGFKPNELCILTEKNAQANEWALILKENGFKVVSAESLLVDNDLRVNLTVSFLKRRLKPSKKSEMKRFAELYFRSEHRSGYEQYKRLIKKGQNKDGRSYTYFDNDLFTTENFGASENFYFKYETVYDLIQQFYRLMNWSELKNPYLHHLADFAYEFEQTKGPDLSGFLDLYEEKKSSLAIQTPSSDDSITVMTIHKSKGLEFPVVIMPNCSFDTDIKNQSKFLIESEGIIIHSNLSKSNSIQAVQEKYLDESQHILTDKMNLCYVAMTRPKNRLYAFNYWSKGFGNPLEEALRTMEHSTLNDETLVLEFGKIEKKTSHKKDETTYFIPENILDNLWFPDIALAKRRPLDEQNELQTEQRFGNQFHFLMAELNEPDQLERKIEELLKEGKLETGFKDRLLTEARQVFNSNELISLYKDACEILSEQDIIVEIEESRRPDKIIFKTDLTVVLDYKTGSPKGSHQKQMQEYVAILAQMVETPVEGYLFYTSSNELIRSC
jgi:ATP-dependent exoDNAse (exonuclease V) beta subunit